MRGHSEKQAPRTGGVVGFNIAGPNAVTSAWRTGWVDLSTNNVTQLPERGLHPNARINIMNLKQDSKKLGTQPTMHAEDLARERTKTGREGFHVRGLARGLQNGLRITANITW